MSPIKMLALSHVAIIVAVLVASAAYSQGQAWPTNSYVRLPENTYYAGLPSQPFYVYTAEPRRPVLNFFRMLVVSCVTFL